MKRGVSFYQSFTQYFTMLERGLWCASVLSIVCAFCWFDRGNVLTLIASIIGVTSLIFNAKGNPFGQFLMVVFSLLYGAISFTFAYYGEMVTYLGMTMPMAALALVAWLRHPFQGNKQEVAVSHLTRGDWWVMGALSMLVSAMFYGILWYFHTAQLPLSTLSVTTSFAAVYLTYRRSPYYAIAYAANDIILIALWCIASIAERSYASVAVCFATFLVNDIYGFVNWRRMQARQAACHKEPQ